MISIHNLRKNLSDRKRFEIESLSINKNDKVALIGDNGAGKTTLLRIILGRDKDYTGQVNVDLNTGYVLNDDDKNKNFADEIYSRANLKSYDQYSPGEYQRLKLIDLLSDDFRFLLMDEPTSHLDIAQKEDLVKRLNSRKTGFLIISHDRDFIKQTCHKIFELSDGKMEEYNGDYKFYLEEREKRQKFQEKEYANFLKEKRRLENLVLNIQAQSSNVRTTPKRMGNSEARLHKMGGQENKKKLDKRVKAVESRISQLEIKEKPKEQTQIKLSMPENKKIASRVLIRAENLNKAFQNKTIFKQSEFVIENHSKVALIGDNGAGKTTLLKMILNREDVWVHPRLKIGYFSQMSDILEKNKSILENVVESSVYDQTMTRIVLGRLGFRNEESLKAVDVLSDGEKTKVKLAKILTSDFNYLIFDEPTNFLDMSTVESLENLLLSYDRPFIFVTHDEEFINNIATDLLLIKDRTLIGFKGNLAQYKERKNNSYKKNDGEQLLLDFRIASLSSRLATNISEREREKLEEEYRKRVAEREDYGR